MKKIFFISLLSILILTLKSFCGTLPPYSFSIEARLKLEGIGNKLGEEWYETAEGDVSATNIKINNKWKWGDGEMFFLKPALSLFPGFEMGTELEMIYNYADRRYLDVTLEKKMKEETNWIKLINGYVEYEKGYIKTGFYYGIGHGDWRYEGDLFGLYPEAWEIEKYLRVGGEPTPYWFEFKYDGSPHKLDLILGPEISWGAKPAILGKYSYAERNRLWTLIYKEQAVEWGKTEDPESFDETWPEYKKKWWEWTHYEHFREIEFSLRSKFLGIANLQTGLLFAPNRVDWEYTYVEEVAEGTGYLGSKYLIKNDKIKTTDGLAFKTILDTQYAPFFDYFKVQYTRAGVMAGNTSEILLGFEKKPSKISSLYVEGIFRDPIIGPNPYIYEGETPKELRGPAVVTPRGEEDPFTVTMYNRKAYIANIFFLFDPTPGWFYRWQPNMLGEWNLNPEEKGPSFVIRYSISYYPTGTDRATYYDETAQKWLWEPAWSAGIWPTKKPVHSLGFMGVVTFVPDYRVILSLLWEDSFANRAMVYTEENVESKEWPQWSPRLVTNPFDIKITLETPLESYMKFNGYIRYGHNIWGPEDWHREWGMTYDNFYNIALNFIIAHGIETESTISAEYIKGSETDHKYRTLASFDEIRLSWTLKSGVLFNFQ